MGRSSGSPRRRSRRGSTCTCTTARWATSPRTTPMASMRSRPRRRILPPASWGYAGRTGAWRRATTSASSQSVNCSAHVAGLVADMFRRNPFTGDDPLADYPNVDGVVALTHKTGCGMSEGDGLRLLRRTLGGYARHVNFSHVDRAGAGLRGEPDRRPGAGAKAGRAAEVDGHPDDGRHSEDRRGGGRVREGGAGGGEPGAARAGARLAN